MNTNLGNNTMSQFFTAFNFLKYHPMFRNCFLTCLEVEVVKVDPRYEAVDNDVTNNTAVRIWLECGPLFIFEGKLTVEYDNDLQCVGETFEEAIIKLAKLVEDKYSS